MRLIRAFYGHVKNTKQGMDNEWRSQHVQPKSDIAAISQSPQILAIPIHCKRKDADSTYETKRAE